MATWNDMINFVRTRYEILEQTDSWVRFNLPTKDGRTQQVSVHHVIGPDGHRWIDISSPVGWADKIDLRRLLELAGPLVEALDRLDENFASMRESADRGTVNIAAGGSTMQYLLPPYVEQFTREYPQVDVRLHNVTGKAGLAQLREGEVDFAVGPMLETPSDIVFHPLVTYEPMLITRAS